MEQRKRGRPDDYFKDWKAREALAEGLIPLVGKLYRENNVKTYIYGQGLVNKSPLDIMQAHRVVRQVEQNELSEFETYPVVKALAELNLGTAHIDAGRIAVMYGGLWAGATLLISSIAQIRSASTRLTPVIRPPWTALNAIAATSDAVFKQPVSASVNCARHWRTASAWSGTRSVFSRLRPSIST